MAQDLCSMSVNLLYMPNTEYKTQVLKLLFYNLLNLNLFTYLGIKCIEDYGEGIKHQRTIKSKTHKSVVISVATLYVFYDNMIQRSGLMYAFSP